MAFEQTPLPIVRFGDVDNQELGRIWVEGNKLHFDGNLTESAHQLFTELVRLHSRWCETLQDQVDQLHQELLTMEHDRDRWKNHHDTEVARARILKTRKDLPTDRRMLYDALRALAVAEGVATPLGAEDVVTSEQEYSKLLDVYAAAHQLVFCRGRYNAELNYSALAELFGQTTPPPLDDVTA
ncbi:hypothetical protein VPZ60_004318 [Salmonella enterica]|nr:hypothetical protein [Salmonella enterica]